MECDHTASCQIRNETICGEFIAQLPNEIIFSSCITAETNRKSGLIEFRFDLKLQIYGMCTVRLCVFGYARCVSNLSHCCQNGYTTIIGFHVGSNLRFKYKNLGCYRRISPDGVPVAKLLHCERRSKAAFGFQAFRK